MVETTEATPRSYPPLTFSACCGDSLGSNGGGQQNAALNLVDIAEIMKISPVNADAAQTQ